MTQDIYAGFVAPQSGATGPKYRRIADELLAGIKDGEYPPGSRLPTKAELMERYSVAINTVERAIQELRKAGVVETVQGAGMFVRDAPLSTATRRPITDRVDELESEVADLREGFSRLQAQVMNLYQSTGHQYPYEDVAAEPSKRARG